MEDNPSSTASSDRNGLRQKALQQLERQKGQGEAAAPEDPAHARQLVQELEVHQVELQLQNEQPLETQRELETSRNT